MCAESWHGAEDRPKQAESPAKDWTLPVVTSSTSCLSPLFSGKFIISQPYASARDFSTTNFATSMAKVLGVASLSDISVLEFHFLSNQVYFMAAFNRFVRPLFQKTGSSMGFKPQLSMLSLQFFEY